ncbi:MAG: c-type cytochrome [Candidatus Aminicenantes bacterium]|nr:c-type cytochrome [Candidatus Aminicenantes bacterium]
MSLFLFKSMLAVVFFAAAVTAVISMLTLMGRQEKKISSKGLRQIHRAAGYTFFIFLIGISIICIHYVAKVGDALSFRAFTHSVLALALFVILVLKMSIVRFFKGFLKIAPQLGMMVFVLAFLVFSTSAGFFFLMTFSSVKSQEETSMQTPVSENGPIERGTTLFQNKCMSCHYPDKEKNKSGPGLKNLFQKEKLPFSNKPVTEANVLGQLQRPALVMPSFPSLSEQEQADLIAYLKTL